MSWEQLVSGVELPFAEGLTIPELHPYPLDVPTPPAVPDIERGAYDAALNTFRDTITPGMTVAVGAGSRGLTGRVDLVRGTISALRELGAEPFVVPAMGSHGGATAEGQLHILSELGITEATVGAEIRATMDTVIVAHTEAGTPVHLDANAAGADRFLPVNRIKPHTCFKGPVESGCMKMAVVGFGKQPGAALVHSCGPIEMRDRLLAACAALRGTGRLLGGIGSIESTAGDIVRIAGLGAGDVGTDLEHELTEYSRTLVPALPFDEIDVLIIERGGKDISGTTMDPNVTGRFWVPGLDDLETPRVGAIVLLDLTDVSGGNALGMGFADFIPASLANRLDFRKTYINCFTAGPAGMRRARMPMVLPDEEACVKAALSMCGRGPDEPKRVVRIESTLHLTSCLVSDALAPSSSA
ncbi:MAG: hypothetical protein R8G01_15540 [Ilumatobacteraceae bacterium]|nr:hypothetical protein [Ilumatobacteraceae bacterium]